MSAEKTIPVAARLPVAEVERLEQLAKEHDRKRSYFIQQAVTAYLAKAAA